MATNRPLTPEQKLKRILAGSSLGLSDLAIVIGSSFASVSRWHQGNGQPSHDVEARIDALLDQVASGKVPTMRAASMTHKFASRGASRDEQPLFDRPGTPTLSSSPQQILDTPDRAGLWGQGSTTLKAILRSHKSAASTPASSKTGGMSAGKNTYTYDAHTYHTKVPPQGIAEMLSRYLPAGGLVLDPFAGSGMTGVAARVLGLDVVLNELSPAASFISDRFTSTASPSEYGATLDRLLEELRPLRERLYTTRCRECQKPTEILYTVWSYRVTCSDCDHEFVLWDHCRHYGSNVKEHKILSEFDCPSCGSRLRKSRLARTTAEPVLVGYKCCSSTQIEHPPSRPDLELIRQLDASPPLADGFYPTTELPDGVNLAQPRRHGILKVSDFYTSRNLTAMSHLWHTIHRISEPELARFFAFTFTSLYQRVTRLSEFRFWGGSGNTAHFNVPYVFNEANVFVSFRRKAQSIRDHIGTTASHYRGRCVVRTGSATQMDFLPDNSVDLVFTDPPFGANINYSEMNILWESWLGRFTETTDEAIVNRVQGKGIPEYKTLMRASIDECYRVLRPGHWMLLVFMNSNAAVWTALNEAIRESGFSFEATEIFDKQHGTFKQFVSDNTAGSDLVLHCRKPLQAKRRAKRRTTTASGESIEAFLAARQGPVPTLPYLHVRRREEVDYRTLYSEWLGETLVSTTPPVGFAAFRKIVHERLTTEGQPA